MLPPAAAINWSAFAGTVPVVKDTRYEEDAPSALVAGAGSAPGCAGTSAPQPGRAAAESNVTARAAAGPHAGRQERTNKDAESRIGTSFTVVEMGPPSTVQDAERPVHRRPERTRPKCDMFVATVRPRRSGPTKRAISARQTEERRPRWGTSVAHASAVHG